MKNTGMAAVALGLAGILVILLIDIVLGRPYMIGTKSIIGLAACGVIILGGIRNLMRGQQT